MIVVAVMTAVLSYFLLDPPERWPCVACGAGLAVDPLVAIAAPATVLVFERFRRAARVRADQRRLRDHEIVAVELVAAGVAAGVSFDSAVAIASSFTDDAVAADMNRWLRLVRHGHESPHSDSVVAEMIRIARSAEASGAALAGQLGALAESELASDEAATEERLARLPIKMLFPLALLILPGFLLVAVAPAVISGIARLGL
jgi:tight adherence protein C